MQLAASACHANFTRVHAHFACHHAATSVCHELHCAVQEPNSSVVFGVGKPSYSPRFTPESNPEPQSSANVPEINLGDVLYDTTSTLHAPQPTQRATCGGGKPITSTEFMWGISLEDAEVAEELRLQRKILRCLQDIPEPVAVIGSGTV